MPGGKLANVLVSRVCSGTFMKIICSNLVFAMTGFDPKQLNEVSSFDRDYNLLIDLSMRCN